MNKELLNQLGLLRNYNQKGVLEPKLKLLIDYIDELEKENVEGLDIVEEHELETLYDILAKIEEIECVSNV